MDDHYYAVIMAGGGGTRLWPLSRRSRPKQMLNFVGERTLFQVAVDRLEGVFPPERIFIVTTASQAALLRDQYPRIPRNNYIVEPMPRGTAAAIALSAVALRVRDEDPAATMAVLTADHFITNVPYFRNLLEAAAKAARDGHLVTLGIQPTFPATGYGYIQQGDWSKGYEGLNSYHVVRFVEKPDEARARAMLSQGNYLWNSGMFIWRVEHILDKFTEFMPGLAAGLSQVRESWNTARRNEILESVWQNLRPETIDYGIMEKADDVVVLPAANLGWNDVGSWESLFEILPTDENGNIILNARHLGIDTHNTLVYAEKSTRLITTLGVRNMVIVDTGDALLVCAREDSQNIKKIITLLNEQGMNQYF